MIDYFIGCLEWLKSLPLLLMVLVIVDSLFSFGIIIAVIVTWRHGDGNI